MTFDGKCVVVTGGASGIGAALVAQFRAADARVASVDVTSQPQEVDTWSCDVSDPRALSATIEDIRMHCGPIDIFVSNAGVLGCQPGGVDTVSDESWATCWSVNVMAHVHAARILLPEMQARGSGHFVNVVSAAGLLNQIGDAAYSATKHAAVSFAESLAISHADKGIGVTLVCPQYVATPLIGLDDTAVSEHTSLLSAEAVARVVLDAVEKGRFLALPHPEVQGYAQSRARDHDEWIRGMTRLKRKAQDRFGASGPEQLYKLL